jgi:hypothetical protein
MVEFSICSQGMGEDNPSDPTEEVMGERSTVGSPIPSSRCPLDGNGGSANIDGNIS